MRKDPTLAVLAGKLSPGLRADCEPLAGKNTLNRLEHTRGGASLLRGGSLLVPRCSCYRRYKISLFVICQEPSDAAAAARVQRRWDQLPP